MSRRTSWTFSWINDTITHNLWVTHRIIEVGCVVETFLRSEQELSPYSGPLTPVTGVEVKVSGSRRRRQIPGVVQVGHHPSVMAYPSPGPAERSSRGVPGAPDTCGNSTTGPFVDVDDLGGSTQCTGILVQVSVVVDIQSGTGRLRQVTTHRGRGGRSKGRRSHEPFDSSTKRDSPTGRTQVPRRRG